MAPAESFSIEAVVLGRNDDYEPGWTARLDASLRYNRARFEGTGVDYRIAFVEWNPPPGRPLLAPDLVRRFDNLRAIVVDRAVHEALCMAPDLTMMLNFAYNPALRTSAADYCLITSGDLFFGRELTRRIAGGLRPGCLYRAERVNIAETVDFSIATPDVIEDPRCIVSVDTCSEPPYDTPPYSHASGDFLLVDRVTMMGLRGFDEGIRSARLHLDSRFCFTAMHAELDCELLGRIFHINHRNAYTNRINDYPGRSYDYNAGLPYINPPDWGLARLAWTREGDRLWRIELAAEQSRHFVPPALAPSEIGRADAITQRLTRVKAALPPAKPHEGLPSEESPLGRLSAAPMWDGAAVACDGDAAVVTTMAVPWGFSAWTPLPDSVGPDDHWFWLLVRVESGGKGEVGIGVLRGLVVQAEVFVDASVATDVYLPLEPGPGQHLLVRNGRHAAASSVRIASASLVSQPRRNELEDQTLASMPEMGYLSAR